MSDTDEDIDVNDVLLTTPELRKAYERVKGHRDKLVARTEELNERLQRQADELGELAALRREVVLVKAGVDVTRPSGSAFAAAYDGELTEKAIRKAWAAHLQDARLAGADFAARLASAVDEPDEVDPDAIARQKRSDALRQYSGGHQ